MRRSCAISFALMGLLLSPALAGTTISSSKAVFQTLDPIQGFVGLSYHAKSVSADGAVVVGTGNSGVVGNVPFIWTAATGTQRLFSGPGAIVSDVSDNGAVVTGEYYPDPSTTEIRS